MFRPSRYRKFQTAVLISNQPAALSNVSCLFINESRYSCGCIIQSTGSLANVNNSYSKFCELCWSEFPRISVSFSTFLSLFYNEFIFEKHLRKCSKSKPVHKYCYPLLNVVGISSLQHLANRFERELSNASYMVRPFYQCR